MLPQKQSKDLTHNLSFSLKPKIFKNTRRRQSVVTKLPIFNTRFSSFENDKKTKKKIVSKYPSNYSNSNKSINAISFQDRKNLKKIRGNRIDFYNKIFEPTNKKKKHNIIQLKIEKSIKNYVEKMNNKINEDYKINQQYDLFNNNKNNRIKLKRNFSGLFELKNGNKIKQNKSMTFLIKKSKPQENILRRLLLIDNDENSLKGSIKKQNIKWLWIHKSIIIEKLIFFFHDYKWFLEKNKYFNKKILEEFMYIIGVEQDQVFIDNIFLLFDNERKGFVNFKKVLFSLIISSNNNYNNKIRLILNLLNEENNQLKLKDFNELLINNIPYKERKLIINIIKEEIGNKDFNILIPKDKFLEILFYNKKIVKILNKFFKNFEEIKNNIEKEIDNEYILKMSKTSLFNNYTKTLAPKNIEKLDKIVNSIFSNNKFKNQIHQIFSEDDET